MASVTRMTLHFSTPFHFGKRGVGLNETEIVLPADGLFAGFCHAFAELYGTAALVALLDQFPLVGGTKSAPFLITSLMPTILLHSSKENRANHNKVIESNGEIKSSKNRIDLLPKPLLQVQLGANQLGARKQVKNIQWVSRTIFQKLLAGQNLQEDLEASEREHPYLVQNGEVWLSRDEINDIRLNSEQTVLWDTETRPRVTVDRTTGASSVFSSGGIHFADQEQYKTALYCLIRWHDHQNTELRHQVQAAFQALGESGIGGERSYGYGHFRPEFEGVEDDLGVANGSYYTTLSPYFPQSNERSVFDEPARYQIVLRRGWLTLPGYSNLRRPTVRMVNTGAILNTRAGQPPVGCLADATPDILKGKQLLIRRYGMAWPVPLAAAALLSNSGW